MDVSLESLKVMVIDDSKTIRRTAETLLKKAGCMVITATDGFDVFTSSANFSLTILLASLTKICGYYIYIF